VTVQRTFLHIAFAFLLLLSQQLGISHAITHLSGNASPDKVLKKQLQSEKQCERCLAFAALDTGLNNPSPIFLRPAGTIDVDTELPFSGPLLALIHAFESRAPPFPA
jgi:hypothetical protein